jgi:nucleoside-diphosphate-sugar epimerase
VRALILGGAGFIGSHLVARLRAAGVDTSVIDIQPLDGAWRGFDAAARQLAFRKRDLLGDADRISCDVMNRLDLGGAIDRAQPDCIYYLAALSIVGQADVRFQEAGDSMIRGLSNGLEIARANGHVRRFVYVSSSMVYGDFDQDPMPEDGPTHPRNLYGGFKLAGEVLTRAYLDRTAVESVIVRPSGVYGPGDVHGRVVQSFCEAALLGGAIRAVNARETYIDFTWVEDLVDGLVRAGTAPNAAGETFNLTYGEGRRLDELIGIINALAPGAEVVWTEKQDPSRPRRGTLDISKARRLIGYAPEIDLETGVARYLAFLRGSLPALAPRTLDEVS